MLTGLLTRRGILGGDLLTEKNEEIRYLRRKCRMLAGRRAVNILDFRWSKLVIAGTCVDLLTDRGIFTGGNEVKEGRIEREIFLNVKIVNADTCEVKIEMYGFEGTKIGGNG